MKISKAKFHGQSTYSDYDLELSWGQLQAIKAALATDHATPIADELYAELSFYLQQIPGPGEDEDALKKAEKAEDSGMASPEAGQRPTQMRADELLPEPGEEEQEGPDHETPEGPEAQAGPEDFGGDEYTPDEEEPPRGHRSAEEEPVGAAADRHAADRHLPRAPEE